MSEKITEYVSVRYSLRRSRSYPRPVHARRIVKVKLGNDFHGEPVYSQYPDRDALCGVHATERADGEVNCADCKRLLPPEVSGS